MCLSERVETYTCHSIILSFEAETSNWERNVGVKRMGAASKLK